MLFFPIMGRGLKWKKQDKLHVQDIQNGGSPFPSSDLEWSAISVNKNKVPNLVAAIPHMRLDDFIRGEMSVEGFETKFVYKKTREPTTTCPLDDKTYGKINFF